MSNSEKLSLNYEPPYYYRDFSNDCPPPNSNDDSPANVCIRVASVAIPFLSLYKPFGAVVSVAGNAMRSFTSLTEIHDAAKTGSVFEIAKSGAKTLVSVAALVLTFTAPVLGILLISGEDIVLYMGHLYETLSKEDYKKAFESCAHIFTSALYLSIFFSSSLELMVISFSAQILLGLYQSLNEFKEGNNLEGCGHLVMSAFRIHQLVPHIETLQFKWEIQKVLAHLPVTTYVGELSEAWEFSSDHLPVGAQVNGTHIGSWNVMNTEYMEWVTEKNSQGINYGQVSRLDRPSTVMQGLTVREVVIIHQLIIMLERPDRPFEILALQECRPQFLQGLSHMMPSHIGMIMEDPTFKRNDQNALLFNKNYFSYLQNESSPLVTGAYADQKTRSLMDIVLQNKRSGEKFQIINAHVPGDPNLPGRYQFAEYVISHKRSDCITVGLGDMNFNTVEMQDAFDVGTKKLGSPYKFENPTNYYTNIGPNKESKNIDHLWISGAGSKVSVTADLPDEVILGLQRIVNLLLPDPARLQSLYKVEEIDYLNLVNARWKNYLDRLRSWENAQARK